MNDSLINKSDYGQGYNINKNTTMDISSMSSRDGNRNTNKGSNFNYKDYYMTMKNNDRIEEEEDESNE